MSDNMLDMIVDCLRLRMQDYPKNSDVWRELNNTIDMLTAKCYRQG